MLEFMHLSRHRFSEPEALLAYEGLLARGPRARLLDHQSLDLPGPEHTDAGPVAGVSFVDLLE